MSNLREPTLPGRGDGRRPIRSYVLREGRLTPGQERAFQRLWPRYGVPFLGRPLDLGALFGNRRPVCLEIGFGNGEALARMASENPAHNYLGVEVHRPGVGRLLLRIEALGLANVRLLRHDAVELLRDGIADAALDSACLFFPDPWHKRRHHKRRIMNSAFAAELARVIQPGGVFHAATDWEDYARQMLRVLEAEPGFENCAGAGHFSPGPGQRPRAARNGCGEALGHGVWDLRFRRR